MLGYAMKEWGMRWCSTVFRHNISNERMRECMTAHAGLEGFRVFKKRKQLHPTGWAETVIKFEHVKCFPLSIMMHTVHITRFMMIEGKSILSPKWHDATSHSAVDMVAMETYRRCIQMLRLNMQHVWVHDVFAVLHRGRPNAEAKASYDDRDKSFDNMKYSRMLKLNRAAKRIQATWAGEANNDMEDYTHAEMLDFTMDELEAVAAQLNENEPEEWHPAAAFAVDLDEDDDPDAGNAVNADVGVEGEIANNDEMAAMLMEADQVGQGDAPEDEDDRARLGDINMQMGGMGLEEADDDGIDDQA